VKPAGEERLQDHHVAGQNSNRHGAFLRYVDAPNIETNRKKFSPERSLTQQGKTRKEQPCCWCCCMCRLGTVLQVSQIPCLLMRLFSGYRRFSSHLLTYMSYSLGCNSAKYLNMSIKPGGDRAQRSNRYPYRNWLFLLVSFNKYPSYATYHKFQSKLASFESFV